MYDILIGSSFFLLLLLSAFFSGTETAFTAVNETSLEKDGTGRDRRAARVLDLIRNRGQVIAALLIGNNIVNTVLPVLAVLFFERLVRSVPGLPPWSAPIIATTTTIMFLLVFGEVIPKNVAVTFSRAWSLFAGRPVAWLITLFSPIIRILGVLNSGLLLLLGRDPKATHTHSIQELFSLTRLTRKAGGIDDLEAKLIRRAGVLNDHIAREIMIPRQEVLLLPADASFQAVRQAFLTHMYSRLPVCGETTDAIVGIVHIKQLFTVEPDAEQEFRLTDHMQKPLFVPETCTIGSLLEDMRKSGAHLALIVDEFGVFAGMLTLEDILEFIVGTIRDEFDTPPEIRTSLPPGVQIPEEGRYLIPGRLPILAFERMVDWEFPQVETGGAATMAGLFLHHFGSLPEEGDSIDLTRFRLRVCRASFRRIDRLEVTLRPKA